MARKQISFKSSGVRTTDQNLLKTVEQIPIGIQTPVALGSGRSGIFNMHFDPVRQISDNLKNLIITNNGERLCNYYYGANLRPLVFELTSLEDFDAQAMSRITNAVRKYMPFVELQSFVSEFDKNVTQLDLESGIAIINLTVRYNIPKLFVTDKSITISLYAAG
jgi:phage baseplate assembly protein W